jgi:hypothetical protein
MVFDKAMKTLKIVANQQLLFPKKKDGAGDSIGIQPVAPAPINPEDLLPPPEKKAKNFGFVQLILVLAVIGGGIGLYLSRSSKKSNSKPKSKPRPRQ